MPTVRHVVVPCVAPFNRAALWTYLRTHLVTGVEELSESVYRRSLTVNGTGAVIECCVQADEPQVHLTVFSRDESCVDEIVARCRYALDLDCDVPAVAAVLARDPLLAPLLERHPGLRVWHAFDGFELAIRAIVGQQVSVTGACTLLGRIVARAGDPVAAPVEVPMRYFPTPEVLATADLSGLGITGIRLKAIRSLSQSVLQGDVRLHRGADTASTVRALQAIPGIGPWTAQYVAMRSLGDPDAFPAADLGLRRALEALGVQADPRGVEQRAEQWRPWRAYATHYLWSTLPGHRPT